MQKPRPPRNAVTDSNYPTSTISIDDHHTQVQTALLDQVSRSLETGDIVNAEKHLRAGLQDDPENPKLLSYLSICVASAGREVEAAEEMAREMIRDFPTDPSGHFALGKVKLLANRRRYAFQSFATAKKLAHSDKHIQRELEQAEPRRSPVFPGLPRGHFLNNLFGRIRAMLYRFTSSEI